VHHYNSTPIGYTLAGQQRNARDVWANVNSKVNTNWSVISVCAVAQRGVLAAQWQAVLGSYTPCAVLPAQPAAVNQIITTLLMPTRTVADNIQSFKLPAKSIQLVILLIGPVFRWDQRMTANGSTLVSAGVEFNQSQQLIIAGVIDGSSLISLYFFVYFWISKKVKPFCSSSLTD